MKTSSECIACFFRQAEYTAKLTSTSKDEQKQIVDRVKKLIKNFDLNTSPPVNSVAMYEMISLLSGTLDPFQELKTISNQQALAHKENVQKIIAESADPLFTAITFAIAGNIIDYGSHQQFDLQKALTNCISQPLAINDYQFLVDDLQHAKSILYLGDNCGEIVFDSLLMKQLPGKVILALKERPIINDALVSDAAFCGLDMSQIISNGTGCPGTPLDQCTSEFQDMFNRADIIISKGQGNFETLSDCQRPVYFLFTVKCSVVAQHAAEISGLTKSLNVGNSVLLKLHK